MTDIKLHNTRTRKREVFTPIDPDNVRMYVCGPTVYDRAHLGNARPVVVFDVLYRLLRHVYGPDHVTYVRNFTDVDDRINETAQKRKAAGAKGMLEALIHERADETIRWYHEDMDALGALRPDQEPRATEFIPQMVAMIEKLIAKGHAYAAEGHVLFAVDTWKDEYGRLSGRAVEDMIAGARVEVAPYKRNPMDFVLWKPSSDELPGWGSPWGRGRPGWHIECSAMARALLGDVFDIHGGGNDLMFPHHENEIAQSCCANGTERMATFWMHNEMLQVEGKKMSKSLGNFFTVRDLLDQGVPGEVIRFVMLSTHYRKPMDWTAEKVREATQTLKRWYDQTDGIDPDPQGMIAIIPKISNDLDASGALQNMHELSKDPLRLPELRYAMQLMGFSFGESNSVPEAFRTSERIEAGDGFTIHLAWSGSLVEGSQQKLLELGHQLFEARQLALSSKDFSETNRLKALLTGAGVEVRVSKDGIDLIPGTSFNPTKLHALT